MKIRKWLYLHSYIYLEVLKLKIWKLKSRTEFLLFIILTTYLVLGDPIGLRKERLYNNNALSEYPVTTGSVISMQRQWLAI